MKTSQIRTIILIVLFLIISPCFPNAKTMEKQVSVGRTIVLSGFKNGKWKSSNRRIRLKAGKGEKCKVTGLNYGTTIIKCIKNGRTLKWKIIIDNPHILKKTYYGKEGKTIKVYIKGVHKKSKIKWKSRKGRVKVKNRGVVKRGKKLNTISYNFVCKKKGTDILECKVGKKTICVKIKIKHSCKNYLKSETIVKTKEYDEKHSICKICRKVLKKEKYYKTGLVDISQVNDDELYGKVEIINGPKKIPDSFCSENKNITGVIIPESVEEICSFAFCECPNLENIKINGNGLKYIRYGAFNLCQPGLKEFPELPDSVEIIEDHAFCHTNNAAFKNGTFKIPKSLKLLGKENEYIKGGSENVSLHRNDGFCTTHIFYDVGGKSKSPLKEFVGESKNYISIDGILYRKKSKSDRTPVYLISVPSAKVEYNQFDYGNEVQTGIYVMPNTVIAAAELSLNNYNSAMKRVVFSDSFDFSKRLTNFQNASYNCSMYIGEVFKGKSYANGASIIGGYGNANLSSYGVRSTNKKYSEYEDCIFSKDYSKLWSVPPCATKVILHENTSSIDCAAMQQSMFGTPFNTNTGDEYKKWIKDNKVKCEYSGERKITEFKYNKNKFKLLENKLDNLSIEDSIVYHTIMTVLKNSNPAFKISTIE